MNATGHLLGEPLDRALAAHVHPLLQAPEARPAVLVERDDLAVEDRRVRELSARFSARSSG